MLVHLSNTSPYVCDLSCGPIEEANRMASAPTKTATALLEQKESFSKITRTPLKLLSPEEIPIDTTATTTTTTTDINASLQPVWYTEQTIMDEQSMQQEDIASIIQEQQGKSSLLPRSTLPPIQSESPSLFDDDDDEELPPQPSLMHKSSTFTIEPSVHIESQLNDSEKENTTNQPIPPSDDSFRALEQLLGLGSGTTVRDSPKANHDTLSLTIVTPTDIINSTSASLRTSIAPNKGTESLPSSQEISAMPTIESIGSINPPSFLMENTTMEDEPTSLTLNQDEPTSTTLNQDEPIQITLNQDKSTDSSEDETNFSFELNDFSNESTANVQLTPSPAPAAVSAPMTHIRAPTCTDVAIRALLKPRRGGRISQPVKADSPLAQPNKGRSSAPTSRMLRSSCRRISTESSSQNAAESTTEQPTTTTECFVPDGKTEFIQMVTLNEEDETPSQTLNLEETEQNTSEQNITPPKPVMPMLSREYTYNTPKRRPSARRRSMLNSTYGTPMQQSNNQDETNSSMLNILLTKPTEAVQKNVRKSARNSPSIASKSMLNVLLTQPTENETNMASSSPVRTSRRKTMNSPAVASKSMLEVLLTKPNVPTPKRKTTSIASKSMLGVLLTQPIENQAEITMPMEQLESSPSIASKSMLGVLLTQPTEDIVPTEPLQSSPSVPSKSMLEILLTQPTETNVAPSPIESSPSIASRSMLNVLLTNPTENVETNPIEETLPIQPSTRQSRRSTAKPSPKVSINPLHSSTPSAPRNKSLQIVSIGQEEQVSTIVPQQEIEIVHLNQFEESFQQPTTTTTTITRTIEMGVQTTPSIDISTRRRFHTLESQTTPIVQMNKSSSSLIPVNEDKPITPLQTKVVVNLQRKVCFQLTPTTDARLAEKEKLEEALRGLKPDIVIEPTPIQPEPKQEKVKAAPVKKAAKPKRKATVEKKTPAVQKAKPGRTKRAHRKQPTPAVAAPTKRAQRKPKTSKTEPVSQKETLAKATATSTKRAPSKEKAAEQKPPVPPTKRAPLKEKAAEQKPRVPPTKPASKRGSRKRTIEEVQTIPEKPIVKRVRTSKSIDLPPPVPKVQANKNEKVVAQPVERQTRTRGRSTNNQKTITEAKTTATPAARTSKRRLASVDKNDNKPKKVEAEKAAPVSQIIELNKDERQKIESLTVAGLKSRLNTHKADIPKGAKKADLIALLIQLETNSLQNQKPTEKVIPVNTTTMTTRRRKK